MKDRPEAGLMKNSHVAALLMLRRFAPKTEAVSMDKARKPA
jgi:hypothetical protein